MGNLCPPVPTACLSYLTTIHVLPSMEGTVHDSGTDRLVGAGRLAGVVTTNNGMGRPMGPDKLEAQWLLVGVVVTNSGSVDWVQTSRRRSGGWQGE